MVFGDTEVGAGTTSTNEVNVRMRREGEASREKKPADKWRRRRRAQA